MSQRIEPLFRIWRQWAVAGGMALSSGEPALVALFLRTTTMATAVGMIEAGVRPASHPTSTTKD